MNNGHKINTATLDKSVPKDQISFLVLSIVFGFLVGVGVGYLFFGKAIFQYQLMLLGMVGSFIGACGFSRKGNLLILVGILFWLLYLPSIWITLFLSSCGGAFAVISVYHFAMARQNH